MWSNLRRCRNWPRKSVAEADNGSARDVRRVEIGMGVCMAGTHTSWEAAGYVNLVRIGVFGENGPGNLTRGGRSVTLGMSSASRYVGICVWVAHMRGGRRLDRVDWGGFSGTLPGNVSPDGLKCAWTGL
jgi:hypothetical protein